VTGVATPTAEIRRVPANGIDFAYLEAGPEDGPLALCLHGFPDHALTFRHLLPELAAAGWHAVAPWMRGCHPTGAGPDGQYQSATCRSTRWRCSTPSAATSAR
jgi:pimeloyl-ACP methyl ester carboxylesterase